MDRGSYLEVDGRPTVRFERIYPHPIERVWAAVTDPSELAYWFPVSVQLEPRIGGRLSFADNAHAESYTFTGTVLAFEPPTRLAFTFGIDELHFRLEATGPAECRLTLTNVLAERNAAARNAAGWTVCLAELDKAVSGAPGDGPHSTSALPWQEVYDGYVADGLPSGAVIPGS